ncbi:Hypothetical protein GLP15_3472 [Giardia lamblia P15]|uniref:Proteasome activator complex subunit 4 C-terminal domain-containing protein n=1 Tax=Giardia intestinalis (strain P15) TaxID=658858 RepID=E1F0E3_GIAIA|nr:Hypothetical protein GLP15_3472 [Giardia lamblia P15]
MSESLCMFQNALPTSLTSWCFLPWESRDKAHEESEGAVASLINGVVQAAHLGDDKGMVQYVEKYFCLRTTGHRFNEQDRVILADIFLRKAIDISESQCMPYVDVARYLKIGANLLQSDPSPRIVIDWRPLMKLFIRQVFIGTSVLLTDNYESEQRFGIACEDTFFVLAKYYDASEWSSIREEIDRYIATIQGRDSIFRYVCLLTYFLPSITSLPLMGFYLCKKNLTERRLNFNHPIFSTAYSSIDDSMQSIIETTSSFLLATHDFYQGLVDELINLLSAYQNNGIAFFLMQMLTSLLATRPDIDFTTTHYTQVIFKVISVYSGFKYQIDSSALSDLIFFSEPKEGYRDELVIPEWVFTLVKSPMLMDRLVTMTGDLTFNMIYAGVRRSNFLAMTSNTEDQVVTSESFTKNNISTRKNPFYNFFLHYFRSLPQSYEKLAVPTRQFIFIFAHTLSFHYTTQQCYIRMVQPIYQGLLPFLFTIDLAIFYPQVYIIRDILFNPANYQYANRAICISITEILFKIYPSVLLPRLTWLINTTVHQLEDRQACYKFAYYTTLHAMPALIERCFDDHAHDSGAKVPSALSHLIDDPWAHICGPDTMSQLTPEFLVFVLSSYSRFLSAMDLKLCQISLLLFLHLFSTIPFTQELIDAHPQLVDLVSLYLDKVFTLLMELNEISKMSPVSKEMDQQSADLSFKPPYVYDSSKISINPHILRLSFASLLANMSPTLLNRLVISRILAFIKENELLSIKKKIQAVFSGVTMGLLSGMRPDGSSPMTNLKNDMLNTLYKIVLDNYFQGFSTLKWTLVLLQGLVRFDHCVYLYSRGSEIRSFLLSMMDNPEPLLVRDNSVQLVQRSSGKCVDYPQTLYIHFLKVLRASCRALILPSPIDWTIGQPFDKRFPLSLCTSEDKKTRTLHHKLKIYPQTHVIWSQPTLEGRNWVMTLMLPFTRLLDDRIKQSEDIQNILWSYKLIFKVLALLSRSFCTPSKDPDTSSVRKKHLSHNPHIPQMIQYIESFGIPADAPLFSLRHEQMRKYKILPSDPRIYLYMGVDASTESRESSLCNWMHTLTGTFEVLEYQAAHQVESCPLPLSSDYPEELTNRLLKVLKDKLALRGSVSSPINCLGNTNTIDLVDIYGSFVRKNERNEPHISTSFALTEPPLKQAHVKARPPAPEYFVQETFYEGFIQYLGKLFQTSLVEPRYAKLIARTIEIAVTNKAGYNLTKALIVARTISDKLCSSSLYALVPDFHCTYERNLRGMGLHLARHAFGETDSYNNSPTILRYHLQLAEYILLLSVSYDESVSKVAIYVLGRLMNVLDIEGDCYRFYSRLIEPCCKYLTKYEEVRTNQLLPSSSSSSSSSSFSGAADGTSDGDNRSVAARFDDGDISKMQEIIMEEVSERLELLAKEGVQITEDLMNKVLAEVMASSGLKASTADMIAQLNDDEKQTINPEEDTFEDTREEAIIPSLPTSGTHMTYLRAARTVRYFLHLSQSLTFYMKKSNRFDDFSQLFKHLYECKNETVHADANEMANYMMYWEPTHPAIEISLGRLGLISVLDQSDTHSKQSVLELYKVRLPPKVCPLISTDPLKTILPLSEDDTALLNCRRKKETYAYVELLFHAQKNMIASSDIHGDAWRSVYVSAKSHILAMTYGLPTAIEFVDRLLDCILAGNVMLMDPLLSDIVELTIFYKPYNNCGYKLPDTMLGLYEYRDEVVTFARTKYSLNLASFLDLRNYLQQPDTQKKLVEVVMKFTTLNCQEQLSNDDESEMSVTDLDAIFLTIWSNLCAIAGDQNSLAMFMLRYIERYLIETPAEKLQKCGGHILAEVVGAAIKSLRYIDNIEHRIEEVSTLFVSILSQIIQKEDVQTGETWQVLITLLFDHNTKDLLNSIVTRYISYIKKTFTETSTSANVRASALLFLGFFMDAAYGVNRNLQEQIAREVITFVMENELYNTLKVLREATTAVLGVSLNVLLKVKTNPAVEKDKETSTSILLQQYCSLFNRAVEAWSTDPAQDEKRHTNLISTIVQGTACASIYGKSIQLSQFILHNFLDSLVNLQTHKDSTEVRAESSAMILLIVSVELPMGLIQQLLFETLPGLLQKYAGKWRSIICIYELAARLLKIGALNMLSSDEVEDLGISLEIITRSVMDLYIMEYGITMQHDELVSATGEFFTVLMSGMSSAFQKQALADLIAAGKQRGEPGKRLVVVECISAFLKSWNEHIPLHIIDALIFLSKLGMSKHEAVAQSVKRFFLWFWNLYHMKFDQISCVFTDQQIAALKCMRVNTEYVV